MEVFVRGTRWAREESIVVRGEGRVPTSEGEVKELVAMRRVVARSL